MKRYEHPGGRIGITQVELAELVDGSQAGVSDALSLEDRGRPRSRLVEPISRALGIPSPSVTVNEQQQSEDLARLLVAARAISVNNPALLRTQVELLEQIAATTAGDDDDDD